MNVGLTLYQNLSTFAMLSGSCHRHIRCKIDIGSVNIHVHLAYI